MLQVHEPILADDPAALLQYERGVFELVSPSGKRMRVICRRNIPLDLASAPDDEAPRGGWWRIEKIAEA
jgi:hypothetical protein